MYIADIDPMIVFLRFELDGVPGTTVVGPPHDNGDGSYDVPADWDPNGDSPGVVVHQPDRDPVVVGPSGSGKVVLGCPWWLCLLLAIVTLVLLILLLAIV